MAHDPLELVDVEVMSALMLMSLTFLDSLVGDLTRPLLNGLVRLERVLAQQASQTILQVVLERGWELLELAEALAPSLARPVGFLVRGRQHHRPWGDFF